MTGQTENYYAIATDSAGSNFAIRYMSDGSLKAVYLIGANLYRQNYGEGGVLDGSAVQFGTATGNYASDLAITELYDGQYLVTWREGYHVKGQVFGADDEALSDVVWLSDGVTSSTGIGGYSVILDMNGMVELEFYMTDINGQNRVSHRLFDQTTGQLYAPQNYSYVGATDVDATNGIGGAPVILLQQGNQLALKYYFTNGSLQTGPVFTGVGAIYNPQVAGLANGNVVISAYDTGRSDIALQIFDADGDAVSQIFLGKVFRATTSNFELTALSNGDFALTWLDNDYVFTERFDQNGNPQGRYSWLFSGAGATYSVAADAKGGYTIFASSNSTHASSHFTADITGTAAADTLVGTAFGETIYGLDGADTIDGGLGGDIMFGGNGDDTYVIRSYGDEVHEGALQGYDKALVWVSGYEMDIYLEEARLQGSAAIDIDGNAAANLIFGNSGANTINGGAGNDTLRGGAGNDQLDGQWGDDILDGGAGNDTLKGYDGNDTASYATATAGVTVSLAVTTAQATGGSGTDTLSDIENLVGSSKNDKLTGSTGNNTIEGGAGNDVLNGLGGFDWVSYSSAKAGVTVSLAVTTLQDTLGAGSDTLSNFEAILGSAFDDYLTGNGLSNILIGGLGDDILNGGGGIDTASYSSASSGVTVFLSTTSAQNTLGAGTDILIAIENLRGSSFDDALYGNSGSNRLSGGAGNDRLYGQEGADILEGGRGRDVMYGGFGADTFVFAAGDSFSVMADVISDWDRLEGDKIDLSKIDADRDAVGDQAFIFNAGSGFSGIGGEIYIGTSSDGFTTVYGDIDGDMRADFAIKLGYGSPVAVQSSDFIL